MSFAELAAELARGATPEGVEVLKRSPLRWVVRSGDAVLKVLLRRPAAAAREARAHGRAPARGLPVPELLDSGPNWLATRFAPGRPAERSDLAELLPAIQRMHDAGMLHGDLHLGNLWITSAGPHFLDVQKARVLPHVPRWLRRRELGYLAHSLGDPLPEALASARFWRAVRAQRHWRSRTRRCLVESSAFTRFERGGEPGFRRREVDPGALARALDELARAAPIAHGAADRLYRTDGWILKRHASPRAARAAWIAGHGLEARGIATGRALAWSGCWLVMQDAGPTLSAWVDAEFATAPEAVRNALADALAGTLAALHGRGIYHADLKANNVCWQPGAEPRLLDYGRVHFGLRVSARRRAKNLAQLNAALPDLVPASLREQVLAQYASRCRYRGDLAALRARVVALSLARRHRWSGC
jgi:tRNA A-37 threonylcarbamoyl transferase component Bud32